MKTISQSFEAFRNEPKWEKMALQCLVPMRCTALRSHGGLNIELVTTGNLDIICKHTEIDLQIKSRSCMTYLLQFERERGNYHGDVYPQTISLKPPKKEKEQEKIVQEPPKKEEAKPTFKRKPSAAETKAKQKPEKKEIIIPEGGELTQKGTIYFDNSLKQYDASGRKQYHQCWRAEICINNTLYRHRSKDEKDCQEWLKAVRNGTIKPTDNKADWWRMEQRIDEEARIDEIVVSAAEEATLIYDYRRTGDLTDIYNYIVTRLLPHIGYYCFHKLSYGRENAIMLSRDAVALMLTRLTTGRPITNMTYVCMKMIRLHKKHNDFYYYERSPVDVKYMVNKIDFSRLADIWKLTRDKRLY